MTDITMPPPVDELAPEPPPSGPVVWVKENLFSSIGNSLQTIFFVFISWQILAWLLGKLVAEERNWDAVLTNSRTFFTFNYPLEQFARMWFSLGALIVAIGITMIAFGFEPRVRTSKIVQSVMGLGAAVAVIGVLTPVSGSWRLSLIAAGAAIAALAWLAGRALPDGQTLPFWSLLVGFAVFVMVLVWIVPWGQNEFLDGEYIDEPGTVNITTKQPWTVMMGLLLGSFFGARALATVVPQRILRLAMVVWWVMGPAFLLFLVLRDPAFDWGYVLRVDIPIGLGFALGGGALLYFLTDPERPDVARIVGALLLGTAALTWILAFFGAVSMLQKVRLSILFLALFALAAATFAGERSVRLRYAGVWVGFVVLTHWLITAINTPSTLDIAAPPFIGGFALTLTIAYYVMLASFPIGALMALARTSTLPIFRILSTTYIEVVRGIPLITVLFFFSIMVPLFLPGEMELSELAAIFIGYTLFSGAYMAENIRGGLQSIRKGQFEAADALGLTTAQRTAFIVLPQALRVSIPNLVGQAIATFKETSLIAIVGGFDLLRVGNQTVASQPAFLGQSLTALFFVSAVYWIFAYSMSRASRSLEEKLGVGTR